jgi:hypothetical protein
MYASTRNSALSTLAHTDRLFQPVGNLAWFPMVYPAHSASANVLLSLLLPSPFSLFKSTHNLNVFTCRK